VGDPVPLDQLQGAQGVKRSMATVVPPTRCVAIDQPKGAAWYNGPVDK
jgi:hypothetical protein